MKKIKPTIFILTAAMILSGCGINLADETDNAADTLQIDETLNQTTAETIEETAKETLPSVMVTTQSAEENPFDYYQLARNNTNALTNIEFQETVYTREGTGAIAADENINLHVTICGQDSENPLMSATGHIKFDDETSKIDIYYKDGTMYLSSGYAKEKQQLTMDEALADFDMLRELRPLITEDCVSDISIKTHADGTKLITLAFDVVLSDMQVNGTGEVLINSSDIITSESFSLLTKSDTLITQTIDCTLLSYNDETKEITFPDLSTY